MKQELMKIKKGQTGNYILPFLWMKGESEEVIREEIAKIDECGIKAICLESRPHPDFMGEKWWSDLKFIIEEAKKREMRIWILDDAHFPTGYANGLIRTKYPERKKKYLNYNVVNLWAPKGEITIPVSRMVKPLVSFLDLDKPRDLEEQKNNKLVAVVAYPIREENKLDEEQVIDLTKEVEGDFAHYTFPEDHYRVYVIYETCTDGGTLDYINMMDKKSVSTLIEAVYEPHYEHLKEEFGKTIAGFFSDEPEIGNIGGFKTDVQIGNSKMALPWSEQLRDKLIDIYGGTWYKYAPFLWTETVQKKECSKIRYHFMDAVSSLYMENFSKQLGEWCSEHKVEYIGHVVEDDNLHARLGNGAAHYFRAMKGQHMAGIDVIGDQVTIGGAGLLRTGVFERDGEFMHYAIGKLGASSGHLDPMKKGRTMCELFGASGWKTGVRDMKWILDHMLVRGVNTLVPHAFSMAEYPDTDCPPHFYARGNQPQFRQFCNLMKYANRMCEILNGGKHIAPVAVLYHAESEWSGECMLIQKPAKELLQHQIDFDFVSVDMLGNLSEYEGYVENESLVINEQEFGCLIIPYTKHLTYRVYQFIENNPSIPVLFIDELPSSVVDGEVSTTSLSKALEKCKVIALSNLGNQIRNMGFSKVELSSKFSDLAFYHYRKEQDIFMFHNESGFETFCTAISLPIKHGAVYYDGMKNEFYRMKVEEKENKKWVNLELAPYGSCIIFDVLEEDLPEYVGLSDQLKKTEESLDLSFGWNYKVANAKEYPNFGTKSYMEELKPISKLLPKFSGHICYEKELELSEVKEHMYLEFTNVFEILELWINDRFVGVLQNPPYVFDVGEYMKVGVNEIKVVVTTTADRDQLNYPDPFIVLSYDYIESSGMYGPIVLHY